ncbi:unnamed protein product [Microthlaspi erraticum]|uniref:Uncharacterized protein n=1 Tax=Microthlaspi erraticum TaxID=1685480 RepID=A0A6D2J8S2_9BRAS|nr:unnamed protein product [Microthlaspi erraticum]
MPSEILENCVSTHLDSGIYKHRSRGTDFSTLLRCSMDSVYFRIFLIKNVCDCDSDRDPCLLALSYPQLQSFLRLKKQRQMHLLLENNHLMFQVDQSVSLHSQPFVLLLFFRC